MIGKLLIANRGEIVRRIARTARRMGIAVATVHSEADCDALHVSDVGESILIGGAPASQSYLDADAIIGAARRVGADALHPGIGFLSEDPDFAAAVEAAGMVFVGPRPETMLRFSDKWSAKREARAAGVPVIGGSEGASSDALALNRLVRDGIALPIMLKAAAGGGGRGVRVVRELDGLLGVIESAMREAQSSFGRPDLIIEEFVERARHLEVQVAGDGHGDVIHLFERECSLQRRFQKVIEEAPSSSLPAGVRDRLLADAVNLARRVNYRNVGTMEFLVAGDRHYFLECNPRLQVEHTVTEEATGIDLVELQLTIAAEERLPLRQSDVTITGHAVQARVYAEDAAAGFIPSTGRLDYVRFPDHARIETGIATGSEITPHYDAMIAKVIAHAADRDAALDRLVTALNETVIFGVETNLDFLKRLLAEPAVRAGTVDNRFIDAAFVLAPQAPAVDRRWVAIAAALILAHRNASAGAPELGLWAGGGALLAWRYGASEAAAIEAGAPKFSLKGADAVLWPIIVRGHPESSGGLLIGDHPACVRVRALDSDRHQVEVDRSALVVTAHFDGDMLHLQDVHGRTERFEIIPFLSVAITVAGEDGRVRAPMMGVIASVKVTAGATVAKGDSLVVQESMKMEMSLEAPCDGIVTGVHCVEGQMVERHEVLVEIMPEGTTQTGRTA